MKEPAKGHIRSSVFSQISLLYVSSFWVIKSGIWNHNQSTKAEENGNRLEKYHIMDQAVFSNNKRVFMNFSVRARCSILYFFSSKIYAGSSITFNTSIHIFCQISKLRRISIIFSVSHSSQWCTFLHITHNYIFIELYNDRKILLLK